jgi:pimeloyl-ACP methyl ester carboxylesterase
VERTVIAEAPTGSLARWYPSLHYARVDGRRIHYLDTGSGPVVLLVHGIGCNWAHWALSLDALSERHRVIAVDLPGFGASEALTPRSEMHATAAALLGLMDALEIEQFAVVGHSLGGLVSWLVAERAPERVTRLGLVDAATTALNAAQISAIVNSFTWMNRLLGRPAVARAILRRPRLRNLVLSALFSDTSAITPELAVWLLTPLTAAPGFLDALWAAPRANKLLTPARMTTPTLITWGTKDTIFSVGGARRLAAQLPDATLHEFTGARHWPMVEQPATFNAALLEFLADM